MAREQPDPSKPKADKKRNVRRFINVLKAVGKNTIHEITPNFTKKALVLLSVS